MSVNDVTAAPVSGRAKGPIGLGMHASVGPDAERLHAARIMSALSVCGTVLCVRVCVSVRRVCG